MATSMQGKLLVRDDLGCCKDGNATIRAFRDASYVNATESPYRSAGIRIREMFILEVQTEHHGAQQMRLSVLELETLWRLISRAMQWRRKPRA